MYETRKKSFQLGGFNIINILSIIEVFIKGCFISISISMIVASLVFNSQQIRELNDILNTDYKRLVTLINVLFYGGMILWMKDVILLLNT